MVIKISNSLKSLWRDRRANVALTFALSLPVMTATMGGVVDYGRIKSARASVQNALDAAVISAFNNSTVPDNARAALVLSAQTLDAGITLGLPVFTNPDASTISGTVSASFKTSFLNLVGVTKIDMTLTSRATASRSQGVATVTATTVSAKGAFDKQIYLFTKDQDGNVTSQTALLDYDYTLNTYNYTSTKVYTPAIGTSKTITVSPYQSYGYYMVAYQDTSYVGKRINPVKFWSDDPNAANFRKTTGDCSTSQGQTDNWEDGGDTDFQDFVATIKCTKGANGPLVVRLDR